MPVRTREIGQMRHQPGQQFARPRVDNHGRD
jgi:hypothetical protein